jgi:uncharacterized membrane protein
MFVSMTTIIRETVPCGGPASDHVLLQGAGAHRDEMNLGAILIRTKSRGRSASVEKGNTINVTLRFSNPFYFIPFCAAVLLVGEAIGARWGHSATAGRALICAIFALLVHDVAVTVSAGISGYKVAMYMRHKDRR